MKIAYMYEPVRDAAMSYALSPQRFVQFVDALGLIADVSVVHDCDYLKDVHTDGFILLYSENPSRAIMECSQEMRGDISSRLILLEPPPGFVETLLEPCSIAAAIDSLSYIGWGLAELASSSAGHSACGLFGQCDVGHFIGAPCQRKSTRYGYLMSSSARALPHLLVAYLQALAARPRVERLRP